MAAISGGSRTLLSSSGGSGGAEKIPGQSVTGAFFNVLGVKPLAGRTFIAEEGRERANVVVVGERLWRSRFGADPKLVGTAINLDGEQFTVIGIVPSRLQLLYESELWTPYVVSRGPEQRRMHYLRVVARLKPGVSLDQARAGMAPVAANIARSSPETNKDWTINIEPLRQAIVGRELRVTSLMLAAVAGFVLLMACANIANLLLARGVGRTREMAVRASLGGSPARILRQLLTESVLLSAIGGAAGFGLAIVLLDTAPSWLPAGTLPVSLALMFDARLPGLRCLQRW
jgi:putative ABC transport system permease protein